MTGQKFPSSSKTSLLRWALRIVCALMLLPVVFFAILSLINMYDPPLDLAIVAAIDATPSAVPDAENSYFVFFGLGMAPTDDPHQYGVNLVAENNAWMRIPGEGSVYMIAASRVADFEKFKANNKAAQSLSWRGVTRVCPEPRTNCLSIFAQKRAEIQALLADNAVRLSRYRSLYHYRYFNETLIDRPNLGLSTEFPSYGGAEHEAILAEIGLKAVDGSTEEALSYLATDTAYWRRVLAGANTLVPKALATTFVDRNYALLSEILAKHQSDQHLIVLVEPMLRPLSMEERDWGQSLTRIFQIVADGCLNFPTSLITNYRNVAFSSGGGSRIDWEVKKMLLLSPFSFKPHATVNLAYQQLQNELLAAAAPGNQFLYSLHRSVDTNTTMAPGPRGLGIDDNYVGKSLAATAAMQTDSVLKYVALTHNLEGRMRLVRTQLELYRRQIPLETIDAYLEQSPPEFHDPYQMKPMHWDSTTRELWFDGIDRKSERKIPELDHRIAVRIY